LEPEFDRAEDRVADLDDRGVGGGANGGEGQGVLPRRDGVDLATRDVAEDDPCLREAFAVVDCVLQQK
jgi:hypothetical protein